MAKTTVSKSPRSTKISKKAQAAVAFAPSNTLLIGMSDSVGTEFASEEVAFAVITDEGSDEGFAPTSEEVVISADPVVAEDNDGLDTLLAALEEPTAGVREIAADAPQTDANLEAAVMGAEAIEASLDQATPDGVVPAGAAPTGTESDVTEEAAPVAAKKVPTPRKHYSDKVERLKDRMGTDLAEYTVLTIADAGVTDEELKTKMDDTLVIIKAMNKKEQNRASMFIEFIAGKKAKPNEVLDRTLRVLQREGVITTGKEGNVFLDLLTKPYSAGAARAMGGNTVSMLADLKVIVADGKGRFIANDQSVLLMKANSLLFPAPVEAVADAA